MTGIEWQETVEFRPPACSLRDFCQGIDPQQAVPGCTAGPTVFIEATALEDLHAFLAHDVSREHGGVLVGAPFYDPESHHYFVSISMAIPARRTQGTPVHLQFTPEAWEHISRTMGNDSRDQVIVGWYHSHPGLGVFMSGTDRATQQAFYNHPWNLAVVVDPIARRTGWFAGPDCTPVDRKAVVPYIAIAPAQARECEVLLPSTGVPKGRLPLELDWLLPPVGLALAALAAAVWLLRRGRSHSRSKRR